MNTYFDIPHRLVGKALYESYYDHFGQMDILSDGSLYLIYRRATEHVGGSGLGDVYKRQACRW